mgnify:CR=1 FL=1
MEQRWTNDRIAAPSGDLEFWAMRHGIPSAANQNRRPAASRKRTIVSTGLAVLAIVAVGVAL